MISDKRSQTQTWQTKYLQSNLRSWRMATFYNSLLEINRADDKLLFVLLFWNVGLTFIICMKLIQTILKISSFSNFSLLTFIVRISTIECQFLYVMCILSNRSAWARNYIFTFTKNRFIPTHCNLNIENLSRHGKI